MPEQTAITTSLNVHPNARRMVLASSRGTEVYANRRCAEIAWFHGVRGARVGGNAGGLSTSVPREERSRLRINRPRGPGIGWARRSAIASIPPERVAAAISRVARTLRRMIFSGRRRYSSAVIRNSSWSVGIGSGSHVADVPLGRAEGSVSRSAASIIAPPAPSMAA